MVTIATIRLVGRETGIGALAHGFRSSFRNWSAELTNTRHALLEATLAHTVRDASERTFARSDISESVTRLVRTERRWRLDFVKTDFCLDWLKRVSVQLE